MPERRLQSVPAERHSAKRRKPGHASVPPEGRCLATAVLLAQLEKMRSEISMHTSELIEQRKSSLRPRRTLRRKPDSRAAPLPRGAAKPHQRALHVRNGIHTTLPSTSHGPSLTATAQLTPQQPQTSRLLPHNPRTRAVHTHGHRNVLAPTHILHPPPIRAPTA